MWAHFLQFQIEFTMRVQSSRDASPWRKSYKAFDCCRRSIFDWRCCSCRKKCSSFVWRIFPVWIRQKQILFCWTRWRFGHLCIDWPQSQRLVFARERRQRHFDQPIAPHLAWTHTASLRRPLWPLQRCAGLCWWREHHQTVDALSRAVKLFFFNFWLWSMLNRAFISYSINKLFDCSEKSRNRLFLCSNSE